MKHFLIPLITLFFALPVFAQVDLGPSLFLSVSPPYPKPNDAVTFTIQNPLVDISNRIITWKNSGTVVMQGEGEMMYRTTAPNTGERMDISVAVQGIPETASLSLTPSSVDVMWESDSYAPGLYRGKHLPSKGTHITLQAFPHMFQKGTELLASQLTFTWKRDGQIALAGKGKSSFTTPTASLSDTNDISVSVTTSDKTLSAERTLSILTVDPPVRLYFEHPLYGTMYHNSLQSTTHVSDTEMSFAAIPYFAQASGPNDNLFSYIWRVNNASVESNTEHPNTLTINAGAAGGEAKIDLSLTHKNNYQLDAHGTWIVTFGSSAGSAGGSSDAFTGK